MNPSAPEKDLSPPTWEMVQTIDIPKDQSYENVQTIVSNVLELEYNRTHENVTSDMKLTYRDLEITIRRKPKPYSYYFFWMKQFLK